MISEGLRFDLQDNNITARLSLLGLYTKARTRHQRLILEAKEHVLGLLGHSEQIDFL